MKKTCGKIIAVLLAGALLLTAAPLGALASEEGSTFPLEEQEVILGGDENSGYALRETVEELGGGTPGFTAQSAYAAGTSTYDDGSMYSQLTDRQKVCYDALNEISISRIQTAAQLDGYRLITLRVNEIYGTLLSGTVSNGKFKVANTSKALESALYTDLCAAIVALRCDKADALWLSTMRYGYKWSRVNDTSVKVTDVFFGFKLEYGGQEKAMWDNMLDHAADLAAQVDPAADTYTKVKTIHDLLAEANTYNDTPADKTSEALSHTAYSALVGGDAYEPVCDGYAKAFKVLCDMLEIPCALASSETHMWNNVKMDDGDWYNLDLTWDDTGAEEIGYDYFLIGSQTQVDGEAFSSQKDHIEENPYKVASGLDPLTLKFPTKNKKAYAYLGQDYAPLTFPDVKRSGWYYASVEAAAEQKLFLGDKEGFFRPDKNITRAEFAQVIANSLNADLSTYTESGFKDVKTGKWFTAPIAWAKETGLMSGYKDNTFRPDAPITRQEMCLVLYNAMNLNANTPSAAFAFPDDGKIATWAKVGVYACYEKGLIKGNSDGSFSPAGNTRRSEAATVFVQFVAQKSGNAA